MGSNSKTAVIRPSFFKPLMDDYSTKLRLPFVFVKKHRNFLPENAKLRIRTGKIWNVKIEEYSDDGEGLRFFTEGWSDFVRDLELQKMQMLVFSLNVDEAAFDVTVYEANSSEREFSAVAFPIPGSNNVHYIDLEESESDGEGECGVEIRPRFEFVLTENRRSRMVFPREFATAAGLNGKSGVVLQFEAQERFWPAILEQRTTESLDLAAGWKDFRVDNRLVLGMSYSFEFDSSKNLILVSICRRSEPSSSSSAGIMNASTYNQVNAEKIWRFVKEVKQHNSTNMYMPMNFVQGTGMERKESIELENGNGRRWRVGIIRTAILSRGWPDFWRGNNLQVGNILLFEFVPNSDKVVKVVVMENEAGKEMLARSETGGMIWF